MRRLILIAVVVWLQSAACGSKETKPTPGSAEAPKVVDKGPAKPETKAAQPAAKPDQAAPKTKTKPAKLTKEQLAELKKRMKAGWAKQKANQWAEAIPEFEAALVAAPQDQRALAELGWSAQQAGDFVKARKADEQAVRVATDKKVKAAALFNLGQVQEKTGDKDGALKSYIASLALRPNKIVEQAVGKLGAKPENAPPFCAAGKKPCDCVLADAFDENQLDSAKCEPATEPVMPVKSFKLYKATSDAYKGSDYTYVLDDQNQLIGVVGGTSERGRTMETTTLTKAEVKTIGGHQVLWLETTYSADSVYPKFEDDSMENDLLEIKSVTLCVIGDAKTPTKCPLRNVPVAQKTDRSRTDGDLKTENIEASETVVELTIADDGTATVKLVKGASDDQISKLVGPHKLW